MMYTFATSVKVGLHGRASGTLVNATMMTTCALKPVD